MPEWTHRGSAAGLIGTDLTDESRVIAMTVMLVGIGFGSVLIGAVAERFVVQDVRASAERVEREVDEGDDELLAELRELSARLARVEAAVRERRS